MSVTLVADNPPLSDRLQILANDIAECPDGFEVDPEAVEIFTQILRGMAREAVILERAASPGLIRLAPGGLRKPR